MTTPSTMTPQEIVHALDQHIIGQSDAKKAVATALRMRWRRQQLENTLQNEVTPKNILMIGPTGVGKTEISRRLAQLAGAPFIKVEASKFTEVGYVGRDVESIVRDLVEMAIKMCRDEAMKKVQTRAEEAAEERVLDVLLPSARGKLKGDSEEDKAKDENSTRQVFRKRLREGELDEKEIEIDIAMPKMSMEIMAPPGMEELTQQLQGMFQNIGGEKKKKRKIKIKDALKQLKEDEAAKLINEDDIKSDALERVEQNGIVFIDEIDKIVRTIERSGGGGDVSREGVQRDLLPLIEGCTISTRYGMVKTDHILFIASGAFHLAKPSDLIPELQGRLPVRVELKALQVEDFKRILTETVASLTEQYSALLATEDVKLTFTEDGIDRIAEIAYSVNERTENIGARRLHTVLERLLDEVSYNATNHAGKTIKVNAKYVDKQLSELVKDEDLSHYIL